LLHLGNHCIPRMQSSGMWRHVDLVWTATSQKTALLFLLMFHRLYILIAAAYSYHKITTNCIVNSLIRDVKWRFSETKMREQTFRENGWIQHRRKTFNKNQTTLKVWFVLRSTSQNIYLEENETEICTHMGLINFFSQRLYLHWCQHKRTYLK
jgi:hypothetical protein